MQGVHACHAVPLTQSPCLKPRARCQRAWKCPATRPPLFMVCMCLLGPLCVRCSRPHARHAPPGAMHAAAHVFRPYGDAFFCSSLSSLDPLHLIWVGLVAVPLLCKAVRPPPTRVPSHLSVGKLGVTCVRACRGRRRLPSALLSLCSLRVLDDGRWCPASPTRGCRLLRHKASFAAGRTPCVAQSCLAAGMRGRGARAPRWWCACLAGMIAVTMQIAGRRCTSLHEEWMIHPHPHPFRSLGGQLGSSLPPDPQPTTPPPWSLSPPDRPQSMKMHRTPWSLVSCHYHRHTPPFTAYQGARMHARMHSPTHAHAHGRYLSGRQCLPNPNGPHQTVSLLTVPSFADAPPCAPLPRVVLFRHAQPPTTPSPTSALRPIDQGAGGTPRPPLRSHA